MISSTNIPATPKNHSIVQSNNGNTSVFQFAWVQPPMPPPLPEDACCAPEPANSLLFGTPAPTRINTAAPTVNSSPSKVTLNSMNSQTNIKSILEARLSPDPRSSSILTKAMAALQLSAASAANTNGSVLQSHVELNIHWVPNIIRLKPPIIPPILDSPVASIALSPTISDTSNSSDFDSLLLPIEVPKVPEAPEFEPFVSTTTVDCTAKSPSEDSKASVSRHSSPCR